VTARSYVELIFDATCPNVEAARAQLREALARARCPITWTEWNREADDAPPYARRYASPTVLVDGHDVAGGGTLEAGGSGCRVVTPSAQAILAALRASEHA
jgi:mercuric ion transport protein